VRSGDTLIVAFSGGPDSTALLAGLSRLRRRSDSRLAGLRLLAAHLDHALDDASTERATAARRLARHLGVPFLAGRRPVAERRRPGESPEMAARRVRYRFLAEVARREGAKWVATAHHRDDQVETVLLRLGFGSGWEGLAGIRPVRALGGCGRTDPEGGGCRLLRPLLEVPRETLVASLRQEGLRPVDDPTNRDLSVPRNRVRHLLRPRLEERWPGLGERLARLAAASAGAGGSVAARLREHLRPRESAEGLAVSRDALSELPPELLPTALAWLRRCAGARHPAGRRAHRELARQLTGSDRPEGGRVGVDCGGGFRWEERRGELMLVRKPAASSVPPRFAYTLRVPGELIVEELNVGVRVFRGPVAPWMLRGSSWRAGLALPLEDGQQVEIRNRRPGDRLHPLGATGSRRLKEILIDRRVPRSRRDRLPLLIVAGRIAWVPGVTIDDGFRIGGRRTTGETVWVAEIFRTERGTRRRNQPAGETVSRT
jgi:tRNA(Ile)-lysidine synthase